MLNNLRAEIARKGISKREMASTLGVTQETVNNWLEGESEPKVSQCMTILSEFLPEYDFAYLFKSDND